MEQKGCENAACAWSLPRPLPSPELGRVPPAYHQAEDEGADSLSYLWRNVIAKLLQGSEEPLQLAELPGAAGWGQLLIRQRRGGRGGRPVAEAVGRRRGAIQGRGRMARAIGYCRRARSQKEEGKRAKNGNKEVTTKGPSLPAWGLWVISKLRGVW